MVLQGNPLNAVLPVMSHDTDYPLSPVLIMKQRRIEAQAVQIDGVLTILPDIRSRNQLIVAVHKVVPVGPHIGVDQIEHAVGIGKGREQIHLRRRHCPSCPAGKHDLTVWPASSQFCKSVEW